MSTTDESVSQNTVLARVTGRVQGVWFRAWTREQAERIGLRGWVRNEPDGSVSALLSGEEPAVAEMLSALHEGPPGAEVAGVETEPAAPPGGPGFRVLR
jgi:acylphosphatase